MLGTSAGWWFGVAVRRVRGSRSVGSAIVPRLAVERVDTGERGGGEGGRT